MSEKNNIVLIGMPGAGKSTLGIVLAKIVGYDFIDADLVIQNQCDKTLQKLLDACGPEGFIAVENQVLSDLKAERSVIATGGSAVYSDEAMKHLSEIGHVVYLQISYDELKSRLSDLQERGVVLKNGVGMSLHELFDERKPLYEKYAEVTVNVDDLTITAAARKVASALKGLVPEAEKSQVRQRLSRTGDKKGRVRGGCRRIKRPLEFISRAYAPQRDPQLGVFAPHTPP